MQRTKITVELEQGIESKQLDRFFNENQLLKLREEKSLKIEEYTKKRFSQNEKVEIFLKVKNIQSLTIKIFEVNTQSYYRKYKQAFKEDIDLDGLLPNQIKTANFSQVSPLTSIIRSFEFPEIQ